MATVVGEVRGACLGGVEWDETECDVEVGCFCALKGKWRPKSSCDRPDGMCNPTPDATFNGGGGGVGTLVVAVMLVASIGSVLNASVTR